MSQVEDFASQAVTYVQRALNVALGYDSETLPVLDHYLTTVPKDRAEMAELIAITAGAYFGEVIRRQIGGRWEMELAQQPLTWRVVLPTGLAFSPMGMVAAALVGDELADVDTEFDAPPAMRPYIEAALAGMGPQTTEEFYSLCGRYDTLAHLHEVLVAVAAQRLAAAENGDGAEGDPDGPGDSHGDGPAPGSPELTN